METREIRLRPLMDADLPTVFQWRNTYGFRTYVMSYDDVVTYDQFLCQMNNTAPIRPYRFIVEHKQSEHPVGFIYCHSHSEIDRSCFLNVYIDEGSCGRGYGVSASAALILYLLQNRYVHCVYFEVRSDNYRWLLTMRSFDIHEVNPPGDMPEAVIQQNATHRFAVTQDDLERVKEVLARFS